MAKTLGATHWTEAEKLKEVPVTSLERLFALELVTSAVPENLDQVRRWRDVFDVLCAAGTPAAWDWDAVSVKGLEVADFETQHALVFTRAALRTLMDAIKKAAGRLPGRKAMTLLDLHDRAEFVLQGSES